MKITNVTIDVENRLMMYVYWPTENKRVSRFRKDQEFEEIFRHACSSMKAYSTEGHAPDFTMLHELLDKAIEAFEHRTV